MVLSLVVTGVLAGSHADLLDRATRRYFGGSLQTILDGELTRLFTSLFLTAGGWRFFASVLMLAACVGLAEWKRGTWRTVAVFFGVHLATMAVLYFVFIMPLAKMEIAFAELLVDARDVGPSAGYYGCLGFALWSASKQWKWRLVGIVFAVLIARLVVSWMAIGDHPHLVIGNVAHLVALPLGLLTGATLFRPSRITETVAGTD